MKKLIKIFLVLLFPFYSAFGLGEIGVSIHDTSLVAGDVAYIPVYVDSSLTGKNVSSFNLQFTYSKNVLKIDSVILTGTLSESWGTVTYNTNVEGKITLAAAGTTDLAGTGILLYLRVKAIIRGGTNISFTDNSYFNEGTPPLLPKNGYIGVNAKPTIRVYPDTKVLPVGKTEQFNCSYGTAPYAWSVTDGTVATIDANGLLTGISKGITRVIATDANGVIDTSGDITVRAFQLTYRDTAFYKGQTVEIPIYTSDLTGLNYTAGEFTVQFDGNILTPLEIITTGTVLSGYSTPQFSFKDNKMKIAFAGDTPLSGSGILLKIKVKITTGNGWGTSVTLSDILFNETDIGFPVSGRFTAWNLVTLSVRPRTGNLLAGDTLRFSTSDGTPPYSWTVSNNSLASVDGSGLLTAIAGGVVTLTVQDVYGNSGNTDNIQIYDTEVSVHDTTAEPGATIDVPIYMSSLSSTYSVVSLQTDVLFDSSLIKFSQVVTTGTSTAGWFFSANDMGNKVTIAGANTTGFNSAGVIVKLRFTVSASAVVGNHTDISMQNFLFNEGSPNARTKSGRLTITAASVLPPAPSNLIALAPTPFAINLTWTDNSSNEEGFAIERTTDTNGTWTGINSVGANVTSFTDDFRTGGKTWYYRVKAYNSFGNSDYSNIAFVTTPLEAPTNLSGIQSGGNNVNLTWTDNNHNETGFIIERKTYTSDFSVLDTVLANITSYMDSNLTVGEEYTYRVKSFNALVQSGYSNLFSIILNNPYPTAPSNLIAMLDAADSSGTINVTWVDNSTNENGFILEHSVNSSSSWTILDTLDVNTTSYTDTNLVDGVEYFYRVTAFNASGYAGYSNVDSAVTVMKPPTNLTGTLTANNQVSLAWEDNSGSEAGYIILRETEGIVTENYITSFEVIDTVAANRTSYIDSTAEAGRNTYIVYGFNSNTDSKYSNSVTVLVSSVNENGEMPAEFALFQNYPNPFNPSTVIKYSLPEAGEVNISVYNMLGEKITTLITANKTAGYHQVTWNAGNVPSGVYLISARINSNGKTRSFTKKAMLLK